MLKGNYDWENEKIERKEEMCCKRDWIIVSELILCSVCKCVHL